MSDQAEHGLYDLGYIEELSGGNKQFVDIITETFLQKIPEQMEQLLVAFRANDLKAMGESAHKMKPTLDLFRIHSLHDTIRFIETRGKKEMSDPRLDSALREVEETVNSVVALMSKK